jgi:hypothetical protein
MGISVRMLNSKVYNSLGDYYVVDIRQNMIVERHLDSTGLQSLERAKKVLADWETIFVNSLSVW